MTLIIYGDYLCPYCRRLRFVVARLRQTLGEHFAYVFRHFPNEAVHPGANYLARVAEAAGKQGRLWDMHDWLYEQEPPLPEEQVSGFARELGLDMAQLQRDLDSDEIKARVEQDLADGRRNGVTGTPALFINGMRYDGAWDFHSMLEALELPVASRLQHSARAFANLPASGGLVLLLAAAAALVCMNTPLAPLYRHFIDSPFGIGPLAPFSP